MARLYRPHIPLSVRVAVAERQLRELGQIKAEIAVAGPRTWGNKLQTLRPWLADVLGCDVSELRLDHDPPLAARTKYAGILSGVPLGQVRYVPDANDPDHLFYRPHGPEHAGSHLIKTNVRGDHGQHPDRILIKKARRAEHGPKPKRGRKIGSPGFYSRNAKAAWPKRKFDRRKP